MLRIVLSRLVLLALPFVVWFVWREIARRSGRPMGATPWAWLAAVGAALFAFLPALETFAGLRGDGSQ